MSKEHPITPPPELVQQWDKECESRNNSEVNNTFDALQLFASKAARWGADQELEACCEWFQEFYKTESWVDLDLRTFRAARRPKPPSLKEQALSELDLTTDSDGAELSRTQVKLIRRALEQLD